jgi:hypothetical protein
MCQRKEQKLEVLKQKLSTQDRIADFSEINKKVAQHKITVASAKFYESLGPGVVPGCKAWDAHVASVVGSKDKFLLPGAFTELLKKQFEISLSAPELGATGASIIAALYSNNTNMIVILNSHKFL